MAEEKRYASRAKEDRFACTASKGVGANNVEGQRCAVMEGKKAGVQSAVARGSAYMKRFAESAAFVHLVMARDLGE
jgi:hypothetical protein